MRFSPSAAVVLCVFFLSSAVLGQGDVVGRDVESKHHKHKPYPPPNPPRPCRPCGVQPICAKGRKCVDRRICLAEGQSDIVCPLEARGGDGYGGHDDGGKDHKDGSHHDGKGDNKHGKHHDGDHGFGKGGYGW